MWSETGKGVIARGGGLRMAGKLAEERGGKPRRHLAPGHAAGGATVLDTASARFLFIALDLGPSAAGTGI